MPRCRQVATLRESGADFRKFYVHSGTSTLTLRAESKEDRWVWLQALQTSKGSWEGMTPAEASALKRDAAARIISQDEAFMTYLGEVGGWVDGWMVGGGCSNAHVELNGRKWWWQAGVGRVQPVAGCAGVAGSAVQCSAGQRAERC